MLNQVIRELAQFLDIPFAEAKRRTDEYHIRVAAQKWNELKPQTVEEVEAFYKNADHYLYELILWNYTVPDYNKQVSPLFFFHNKKILEIGAGVGSLCIALHYAGNQMTYCDINPTLQEFAKQRFSERGFDIPIVTDLTGQRGFDMVVAIDFFEHIHKDALPELLKEISAVLKDNGVLYHRSTFGQQTDFPMHFDHSDYFNRMAKEAGLNLKTNGDLVKDKASQGVQIGVPIRGDMGDNLFYSFLGLKKPLGTKLTKIRGVRVDDARNTIIRELEKDWLFFMDSDQTFHPDTLNRLLSWDLPIVTGIYFQSPGNPTPHIYKYEYLNGAHFYKSMAKEIQSYLHRYEVELREAFPAVVLPARREDLLECDGIGGGCLLVHRRVLEAIKDPWFECTPGTAVGEDFNFCRKVQSAGFKIFADPGVLCGHEQKDVIGYKHFLHWADPATYPYPWGQIDETKTNTEVK